MKLRSLRLLKMDKASGILDTKEKVREFHESLDNSTRKSIQELDRSKRLSWAEARNIVLD